MNDELMERLGRFICRESCVEMGDPPCSKVEPEAPLCDPCIRYRAAILSELSAAGFVVVPEVPTPEMIAAALPIVSAPDDTDFAVGRRAIDKLCGNHENRRVGIAAEMSRDYRSMLKARPV